MPGQQLKQAPTPSAPSAQAAAVPDRDRNGNKALTYYPFYTFSSSPTFNTWAKLTCHTIQHELQANSSFPSRLLLLDDDHRGNDNDDNDDHNRLLLFYLNHPIQYVQVTGVIVSIDEHHVQRHVQHHGQDQCQITILSVDDSSGATVDVVFQHQHQHRHPTNANPRAGNTNIDTAHMVNLLAGLAPGTVLRAKGTLRHFRGRRQVRLLRGEVISSTAAEMRLASARARFYSSVLAKPWTREWEREEVERAKEAEVARRAGEEVEGEK
ncbi:hypothetical protein DV737_g2067, partial [Chaetothyriales sp. CBS 132003]